MTPPGPAGPRVLSAPVIVAAGGLGAAVLSWLGSWTPSYWGDEAASVLSASRSLGSLLGELGRVDAVHGVYYLLLHGWVRIFGASELSTRAPSALAIGLAVSGTMLLALRLAGLRVAVLAGAVGALLPRLTWAGTEARSYALACAAGVWLTVALVGLLRKDGARRGRWIRYSAGLGAAPYLFLFLGLLIPVHGLFLAATRTGRVLLRRWLLAAAAALVLAAPIVVVAAGQRQQVAFLARRHYLTPPDVLVDQWFGSEQAAWVCWALLLCGLLGAGLGRSATRAGERRLALLAGLWLALPTGTIVLVSLVSTPTYNMRYLSFSTPAAALLIALGVNAASRWTAGGWQVLRSADGASRRIRAGAAGALVVLVAAVSAPIYAAERGPYAKDGGSDWREVSAYVGAHAARGDAVVFDETTRPSQDPRLALRLYPAGFRGLRDVELRRPYFERPYLWDDVTMIQATYGELTPTVWAVELSRRRTVPADIVALTAHGYELTSVHVVHRDAVYRLERR